MFIESSIKLSPFQKRVLGYPEDVNLFLTGGRGGGKTFAAAVLAIEHILKYDKDASVLYVREYVRSLVEFERVVKEICSILSKNFTFQVSGENVEFMKFDIAKNEIVFYNGAKILLSQIKDKQDLNRFETNSYTLIIVDEISEFSKRTFQFQIENLRKYLSRYNNSESLIPSRLIYISNTFEDSDHIYYFYINGKVSFKVYDTIKYTRLDYAIKDNFYEKWAYLPSTYKDNPFIDQERYINRLKACNVLNPKIMNSWVTGNWNRD